MAEMIATPTFTLTYQQKNITRDIAPYLLSASYTDNLTGESDELELELEDTDRQWLDAWYPVKGDTLAFAIGYLGQPLLQCGSFEIDEIEFKDSPSTVCIRGLSAGVSTGLRTRQHRAFDDTTLADIVGKIARQHGYKVQGTIEHIPLDRVTQTETDLVFLKRLATTYGYAVKITGKVLVFSSLAALKNAPSSLTLSRFDLASWGLRDQIHAVYQSAQAKHHNPQQKKMQVYHTNDGKTVYSTESSGRSTSADTLKVRPRAADPATQETQTKAALAQKNDKQTEGQFSLFGNTACRSGAIITMQDFGRLSGRWRIKKATHHLDRSSGYVTDVEYQRVDARPVERSTKKAAKKSSSPQNVYGVKGGKVQVIGTSTPKANP